MGSREPGELSRLLEVGASKCLRGYFLVLMADDQQLLCRLLPAPPRPLLAPHGLLVGSSQALVQLPDHCFKGVLCVRGGGGLAQGLGI